VKIPLSLRLPAALRLAAPAAADGGIVPVAPLAGSSVSRGHAVTFRMHVSRPGELWVHVCRSARVYDFPGFWLDRRGTCYRQAYRIHCVGRDCRQEGPVVRFRVA
jgi:hypothetical protein